MILNVWLNGKKISEEISADTLLIDFVLYLLKINLYYLALCSLLVLMASI